jgi:hypothetical protein
MGAREHARLIAPITMRIIGQVLRNAKVLPCIWSSRNNTPMVMISAGPRKLRMVQRGHLQRLLTSLAIIE